jgi:hypothetical protein
MSQTVTSESRPPSLRQVALGLFILFQLAFLLISNPLGAIRQGAPKWTDRPKQVLNRLAPGFADQRGHGWDWCAELDTSLGHWAELTGQEQNWCLFSPSVSKATGFPAVLMLWDDPPPDGPCLVATQFAFDETNGFNLCAEWNPSSPKVFLPALHFGILAARNPWEVLSLHGVQQFRSDSKSPRAEFLLSENEPEDIHHFVRFGNARLRRYEGRLYADTQPKGKESSVDLAARLSKEMQALVRDNDETAVAYLRWRMDGWQRAHPDTPAPKQVVLLQRSYRIRGPEEEPKGWDGPLLVPCARWLPDAKRGSRSFLMEPFDFSEQRFKLLAR